MAKDWFPFYLNDYLADTPFLSLAEHGAFCLLMMFYWNSDANVPASADRLHKICRCTTDAERDAVDHVVREYFSEVGGKLVNDRLDKIMKYAFEITKGAMLPVEPKKTERKTVKRFTPPTLQQVQDYCNERGNHVDAEQFIAHYEANGWFRGKTKIKSWQACVRTWEKTSKPGAARSSIQTFEEKKIDITKQGMIDFMAGVSDGIPGQRTICDTDG